MNKKTKQKRGVNVVYDLCGSVEIDVQEIGNAMFLTQHLGNGNYEGVDFDACLSLPNMNFIIKVDKKRYMVTSGDIIRAVMKLHQEEKVETKK